MTLLIKIESTHNAHYVINNQYYNCGVINQHLTIMWHNSISSTPKLQNAIGLFYSLICNFKMTNSSNYNAAWWFIARNSTFSYISLLQARVPTLSINFCTRHHNFVCFCSLSRTENEMRLSDCVQQLIYFLSRPSFQFRI